MKPPPFAHQLVDTMSVLNKPAYALFNEPGTGKSRTVVDAIFAFVRQGRLDHVIIVCPANVRSIWADPSPVLGEFAKWAPDDVPYALFEYTARLHLDRLPTSGLVVLVTNPEFVRRNERLIPLQAWASQKRTFLVLDESWAYKTPNAAQTKAMQRLRRSCGRVVILNGTPGEPREQYSQFAILDRRILNQLNHAAFKAHYCVMGGYMNYQVIGYRNMDEFTRRTAPFCIVRKIRDCVDIGPEPLRTQIEAPLSKKSWARYCDMRDELITWLSEHEHAAAVHAAVKVLRLAQIANGFVGGVEAPAKPGRLFEGGTGEKVGSDPLTVGHAPTLGSPSPLREIGRDKLDALMEWLRLSWDATKLLIFTRFRADVERTALELAIAYPCHKVSMLYGGLNDTDQDRAKRLLAPGGDPAPAIVVANAAAGGVGLNLAATSTCVFLANDFSFRTRRQAEGRVDRPGQTRRVTFLDILAVGPDSERTIDHAILAAMRRKERIERWTTTEWLRVLKGENYAVKVGFFENAVPHVAGR